MSSLETLTWGHIPVGDSGCTLWKIFHSFIIWCQRKGYWKEGPKYSRYMAHAEGPVKATSWMVRGWERWKWYKWTHCVSTMKVKWNFHLPYICQVIMMDLMMKRKLKQPTKVRARTQITPDWGRGRHRTLTSEDLPLLPDVPGVQGSSLLGLHRGALVEVLGEVWLVQTGDINHFPLGDVVLLHVAFDHFGSPPRVLTRQRSRWLGCWWEMSGEKYSLARALPTLYTKPVFMYFSTCSRYNLERGVRLK